MVTRVRKTKKAATSKVAFELLAPHNESVALVGSWNDWQPMDMQRGDDGVWRVDVDLPDGDYEYQFELVSNSDFAKGERVRVADPEAVEFGSDDKDGATALIKVRDGNPVVITYDWQHDDVPLPPNEQLIIYEMHIGDFRGGNGDTDNNGGDFQRVIDQLDYLTELGVNAVELMPVNQTAADNYWGYSQRSIYAVEKTYGTPDDLCRLVDECHARGIRVIHDAVFNHIDQEAPLIQIDNSYWFYNQNPDEPELQFGPKFNYEYYDEERDIFPAREHVIGAINLWISHFHMDGIRFDSARAIKYFDLLHWFNDVSHNRAGFKPFYTIAEHLPQDPAVTGPDGPTDAAWHDNFYRQLICTTLGVPHDGREPFLTDEILRLLDPHQDGFASAYNVVRYLNNHDQERVLHLLAAVANTYDDAAFRRNKLGATLLLTAPGIPMLWMGEEFGQATPRNEKRQPLDWSLLDNERNKGLWEHYRHLIHLRKTNPALYSDNFEAIANMPERGIIAFKRWNDEGNVVIVAANLVPQYAGEVQIPTAGVEDGRWHEAIYGYDIDSHENRLVDTLAESEVKVYIKQ